MRLVNDPDRPKLQQFDIGDVVRRFRYRFGREWWNLSLEQKQAIEDISDCMTKKRGGRLIGCRDCGDQHWTYNGCKNRSCPKCHGTETREWIARMAGETLPCPHFHVTVCIPTGLHVHFYREDQEYIYGLFMTIVREQLMAIANNPKYLGANVAILQLLHTWNGRMEYHPHIHIMVSAGRMKNLQWIESNRHHLVPSDVLAENVRKEFQRRLQRARPEIYARIKPSAWRQKWDVDSRRYEIDELHVLLSYLSKFVYRVAITKSQLLAMDENTVTYRYKDRETDEYRYETLDGGDFLKKFVRHVLPKDFHKTRKSGLYHHSQKEVYYLAVAILEEKYSDELAKAVWASWTETEDTKGCPFCGSQDLYCIREVKGTELLHDDTVPHQNRHGP